MHALSTSVPQLGQSQGVPQDSLPKPSAPPLARGSGAGSHQYPPIWQAPEGESSPLQ